MKSKTLIGNTNYQIGNRQRSKMLQRKTFITAMQGTKKIPRMVLQGGIYNYFH